MRVKSLSAALAIILVFGLAAVQPAQAGWLRDHLPDGWGSTRKVTHHIYYPRYAHVYRVHPHTDPYAYRYEPRGYYTHSSSRYWRHAHRVHRHAPRRAHHHKYRYKAAWGYKKSRRHHRRWR